MIQDDVMSVKSSKSINDWEIIDEFYDPAINTSSKATDMALTKRNKYQGLEDFAKKIAEDEAKKQDSNKNEKRNWLIPALALKLPSFLNPLIRKESTIVEDKSLLLEANLCEKKPQGFIRNTNRTMTMNPPNIHKLKTEMTLELQQHLNRISSNTKNKMTFNTKFPKRLIKRRVSCDLKKRIEFDESPTIRHRRKLSFKAVENKDRIQFLQKLKPKLEEDLSKTQVFKLTVSKIEQMLKNELNEDKKKEENKIEEENEEEEKQIRKLGPWDEIWEDKAQFIQKNSPYGHFPSYKLRCLIIKGGDDLRQEILAMQLIIKFKQIFDRANIRLYIRPYEIIVTSANSGILGI